MKRRKFFGKMFLMGAISLSLVACSSKMNLKESDNTTTEVTESSESNIESSESENTEKIKIISEIFPTYDWIKVVAGENINKFDLNLLLDKGNDLHNYIATAKDISDLSEADLFIYVGGTSDRWVGPALKSADNEKLKTINLVELLGDNVKIEELVEGMQEEEHDHEEGKQEDDHDHEEGKQEDNQDHAEEKHEDDHEEEIDEHVWLSLKNAQIYVLEISKVLSELDPASADIYEKNAKEYINELDKLDKEYAKEIKASNKDTILVGDRFPFRYLVDDYNLKYYAAFVGCSAETEASFDTVIYLAKKLDELKLDTVLTIDGSNTKVANTIVENTTDKDEKILVLDSLQSINKEDIENGKSYLDVMKGNLEILKQVLK